ncbi:hypothetical protein G3580_07935 [Nitrogeniibacter mangrovi]|uniref:Uncharacterized protein n=1 Tax=Nitrogeniibacter mangrovi TaxID=2016596 RepID=A0A6C1B1T4_9RHOO|nr:hypothetical protein [Nitrogeniibacter mangrovi]QID17581.1 hypothetical protein G3580_07935 [Nitrogeniibacter mangrovi]
MANIKVANFVCKFGGQAVMLDHFFEVIYPAFFNSSPRTYGDTTYHFFDLGLELVEIDGVKEPVLFGRFVRDAKISRTHVLEGEFLRRDDASIDDASAAHFSLILSNHTLAYVALTSKAPSLQSFRATVHRHVLDAWKDFTLKLASEYQKSERQNGKKILKNEAVSFVRKELVPMPTLELRPLPSAASIKKFLMQFEKISWVKYSIEETNHTLDSKKLVQGLRAAKKGTNSESIELIEKKPKDKAALAKQMEGVVGEGNVGAQVKGTSSTGAVMTGSNEEMAYSSELDISGNPNQMAAIAVQHVFSALATGILRLGFMIGDGAKKADAIRKEIEKRRG